VRALNQAPKPADCRRFVHHRPIRFAYWFDRIDVWSRQTRPGLADPGTMPGTHPVARAGAGHPQVVIETLRSIAGVGGRNESRRHRAPAATFG
jgi:hypothetical protein